MLKYANYIVDSFEAFLTRYGNKTVFWAWFWVQNRIFRPLHLVTVFIFLYEKQGQLVYSCSTGLLGLLAILFGMKSGLLPSHFLAWSFPKISTDVINAIEYTSLTWLEAFICDFDSKIVLRAYLDPKRRIFGSETTYLALINSHFMHEYFVFWVRCIISEDVVI